MRYLLVGALIPTLAAALLAAQTSSTASSSKTPPAKPAPKIVTLIGCVTGSGASSDPFTLSKTQEGVAYRLTGTNMRGYVGQRVQIYGGTDTRRLKIVGGFVPSTNVAAQAGALDPAQAAVASDPLVTAGKADQTLPEFRVRTVRPVSGSCE